MAVIRRTSTSDFFLMFEGWVKVRNLEKFRGIIDEVTEGNYILSTQESRAMRSKDIREVRFIGFISCCAARQPC